MSGTRLTPRLFLARELQLAREAKGLSPDALAKSLYVSESLIRSWEKGRRLPKPDILAVVEQALGTGGTLTRLLADLVDAAVPIEWFGRWIEIEEEASAFWSFEPLLVPGLLQTPEYARSVLRTANHLADLDEMIDARIRRQAALSVEDAPMLVCLIAESALRHSVGGPEVMYAQCLRLLKEGERENIVIHVVPDTARACAGFMSGFMIADIGGRQLAYVDNQVAGEVAERPEDITRLHRWFDLFRADSLSRDESTALISRTAETWKALCGAGLPIPEQTAATA
ncbi:helix-turn-helix domain-containing protein [Actinocorallia aurea]